MSKLRTSCTLWSVLVGFCLVFSATQVAQAQVASGVFTGMVSDPTGAIIPGATVTATNEATNVSVTTRTTGEGLYTIPSLSPGTYTLKAEAKGFKGFVNQHIELTVGYTQRVDFKLVVGELTQAITVESQAPIVDTATSRMSELVTAQQVQNLPLNGRNVFQLIQLAPGAVNTTGLVTEPGNRGFTTVVNGARVNMNGYLLDGISDKGLSGGSATQPSVDTVQEFRVDTEVLSAEYGSTVGAVTTIVTKQGTNSFHGNAYDYMRNDKLNAREFFENDRNPFHMNQFGATFGGPIKRNKIFFFGSYEGERTRLSLPQQLLVETPQWGSFVQSNLPNSVAALLYKDFPAPAPTSGISGLEDYVLNVSGEFDDTLCKGVPGAPLNAPTCDPSVVAANPTGAEFCSRLEECLPDIYGIATNSPLGQAMIANRAMPTAGTVNASARETLRDQFFNGNQFSGKIDFQGETNKVFGRFFYDAYKDNLYTPATNGGDVSAFVGIRGFRSPFAADFPHFALGWTHTFGPATLNDLRAGWSRNNTGDINPNAPGVPQIVFDTGEVQFGNYNGYPQIFHEEIFHFTDMVSLTRGRHNVKIGGEVRRNYENSEFNVGRPSYGFLDDITFALGQVESVAAGTEPGAVDPATGQSTGLAHLASNVRGWRNIEVGAFINDDWKVTPRLTLTLGLRYDLYTRHRDKYHHETQFILPSAGSNLTERLRAVNCYENISGVTGFDGQPCNGGFAPRKDNLTTGDHNNFGPRVGFAWDVFGNGKTAVRGGGGVSYQGEIYNPLSNSRWNPPYYSFNLAFCGDGTNNVGPGFSDACVFGPVGGGTPTYTGDPNNAGQGPASATFNAFQGNIMGWNPYNANGAFLTGIAFPNFRDPYVYGSHFSVEHEFPGQAVLKLSWVGTFGHKLYRAEDINRHFGGRVDLTASGPTSGGVCSLFGPYRVNCLFGRMRVWENSVNSNYNALQVVLNKRMSHGLELHSSYVWSHSLDTRSTWHSGATTSNGAAEGFSMDQALPGLDYGNSIFDVRHRFTTSFVWELPWERSQQGAAGHILGGWQLNGAISFHGGFPWTPYCHSSSFPKGCDFNRDGVSNDRPNAPSFGNSYSSDRTVFEPDHPNNLKPGMFYCKAPNPDLASCTVYSGTPFDGNLGRNTFRGPDFSQVDFSLFKNIKVTEQTSLQFRAEAFNIFNRTNLKMPQARIGTAFSQFGLSQATFFPRQVQFALKLIF